MPILTDRVDGPTMERLDSLGVGGLVVNTWNWNSSGFQSAMSKNWTMWANDYYMYPSGSANRFGGVQENLWNPGFEVHRLGIWPDGWQWSYYDWPRYDLTGAHAHSGIGAVAADDLNCYFWTLGAVGGWEYDLGVWARGETGSEAGRIVVGWYNADVFLSFNYTVFQTGPQYSRFSLQAAAPPGANVARIIIQGHQTGRYVWFDDAMARRVDPAPANRVANGGFETDANSDGVPDGWTPAGQPFYDRTGTASHDGGSAVRVNGTDIYYQMVPEVLAGDEYYLGEWIMAEQGAGPGELAVLWLNLTSMDILGFSYNVFYVNTTYAYFDMTATAPPGADLAVVVALSAGSASVWVDDAVFYSSKLNDGVSRGPVLDGHPELEQQGLYYAFENVTAPASSSLTLPPGVPVSTVAAPVQADGSLDLGANVDVSGSVADGRVVWRPDSGTWRVMAFTWDILYNGTEVDPAICNMHQINVLNRVAVGRFIEEMYEKTIYGETSQYFGSLLRASFTDEVSNLAGYFLSGMRYPVVAWLQDDVNGLYLTDTFGRLHGYDLLPVLPALWNDVGPRTASYRVDFYNTTGYLQGEAYYGLVGDWCARRGINFSGHPLGEDSLTQQCAFYGDMFECVKRMGYPGMDTLLHQAGNLETDLIVPKFMSSVALLYGKPHVMTEYSVSSNDLNYRNMTAVANWEAVQGVDTVTSFSFNIGRVPDADLRRHSEQVGRTNYMLQQGNFTSDIAVLYPTTSVQADYIPRNDTVWNMDAFGGANRERSFRALTTSLLSGQLDFVYLNDESVQAAAVDGSAAGGARLRHDVSAQDFRAVILPEMDVIRTATLEKICDFYDAGGAVVATGALPSASAENGTDPYITGLIGRIFDLGPAGPDGYAVRTNGNGGTSFRAGGNLDVVREKLRSTVPSDLVIAAPGDAKIYYMKRTKPGFDMYFLVNNGQSVSENTYEFRTLGEPSLWNAEDGTVTAVWPARYSFDPSTGYTTCVDLVVNGFSSVFVVFSKPALALGPQNITFSPAVPLLGDTVGIGVDVLNIGPGTASRVAVEVFDGTGNGSHVLIGRAYPIEIDACGSAHIDIIWSTAGAPGNRSIRAAAVLPDGRTCSAGTTVFVNTPPVARIEADRTEALTSEDFRFSSNSTDPDGHLATFSWDFGDGNGSHAVSAVHHFSDGGIYTVALTVTDSLGASSSASVSVTVLDRPPAADFTVFPGTVGNATTDFLFDASASTDADGSIRDFRWDLGDGGKAAGMEASHRYGRPGVYGVRLNVTDDDGSAAETVVNITVENLPPVAGFSFEPPNGNVTTAFAFSSTANDIDGRITRWEWDFGDGTNGTGPSVSHRFPGHGMFVVTLNVTDELGLPGNPFGKEVNVSDLPPVAVADALMKVANVGRRVTFSASQSFDPDDPQTSLRFLWNFGDGSEKVTGITASHTYSRPGIYDVMLTVSDDDGEASSVRVRIEVRAAAAAGKGSGDPPAVAVGLAALIALGLAAAVLVWRAKRGPPAPPPAGGRPE